MGNTEWVSIEYPVDIIYLSTTDTNRTVRAPGLRFEVMQSRFEASNIWRMLFANIMAIRSRSDLTKNPSFFRNLKRSVQPAEFAAAKALSLKAG